MRSMFVPLSAPRQFSKLDLDVFADRLWKLLQTGVFKHWYDKAVIEITLDVRIQMRYEASQNDIDDPDRPEAVHHGEHHLLQIELRHLGSVFVLFALAILISILVEGADIFKLT